MHAQNSMATSIKWLLLNIAHYIVTVLAWITPKDDCSILIYGSNLFDDNSRALYKHLVRFGYNKKYRIICTTKDIEEYRDTDIENVVFTSSLFRILLAHVRSKYIFYSMANVFTNTPCRRQVVVNMWHGTPLKRIGYLDNPQQWRNLSSVFTYLCVASEYFKTVMMQSFGCTEEQILINGNPRCDALLSDEPNVGLLFDASKYDVFVLWMPTYRTDRNGLKDSISSFPILTRDNIQKLSEYLQSENVLLVIKPHRLQMTLDLFSCDYPNVLILQDEDLFAAHVELYTLLAASDALITDYSSVFYDYMLLDRPIGFSLDDWEDYSVFRGFNFSHDEVLQHMAGEKFVDLEGLMQFLSNVKHGVDIYKDERRQICNLANDRKSNFSQYLLDNVGITSE